jgi:hypothetical protein
MGWPCGSAQLSTRSNGTPEFSASANNRSNSAWLNRNNGSIGPKVRCTIPRISGLLMTGMGHHAGIYF